MLLIILLFMFQIWTFLLGHTAGRQSWVAHCKLLLSHSSSALVWCKAVGSVWDEGGFVLHILTGQWTLYQPCGADYAHQITTRPPGFSELPSALCWCWMVVALFHKMKWFLRK